MGEIHFQLTAQDGSNPDASSDWAITYDASSNYLAGTDCHYAWCSATADIPHSTDSAMWTVVSFTGVNGSGHTISLDAAALNDRPIKDPDSNKQNLSSPIPDRVL